ncbi:hypothetical protein POSPLADRAFT_1073166 [Postia placenta MAD-698-R-SB12]|uniref:Zn(2)-C6 fungal-type domain-containing protein n=1 Tax=Postia placenta MAD-698-R-SB12 TaxID=670580 RepID=A0A1X6N8D2_9APHY|nr:hypothetical protein POSPLADRAFT_1073166 [Postia placenta MAD-698-R-SB12]OSX64716.1 hypothetical protein POSPLADRAFT_1073166 [Postia placenta MAD-698-R-SB12]
MESPMQKPATTDDVPPFTDEKPSASKAPVVRGARACTVCRAAKMKCVGADDGNNIPCQRCKRSGAECIFEKHRRGRKPGSRLSEASKMLRRLEKGLNTAKQQKSTVADSLTLPPLHNSRGTDARYPNGDSFGASSSSFSDNKLPPLNLQQEAHLRSAPGSDSEMEEDDDSSYTDGMYPARMIKQNARNSSFFKTILNPEQADTPVPHSAVSDRAYHSQSPTSAPPGQRIPLTDLFREQNELQDPVDAGLIDEETVSQLWDMFFIRLNPFICLFDPALHSVSYVRKRSPFLFTALIMACCKFFKTELYVEVLQLAHKFAVRAFAENQQSVEVVQAFACMTYWKEPDDTRTWTYIGYACRMSVELGLNRYVGKPQGETELQLRERRNRERTYLVLFVHDRSLSMQTGKHWMLPVDELVRHTHTWHEEGGAHIRQEDVIVAAFTDLRTIAADVTDVFNMHHGGGGLSHEERNYEMLLRSCNQKLNNWVEVWQTEMRRAKGNSYHFSMLMFFQLHVRLFLNTFVINSSSPQASGGVNIQALNMCYTSAMDNLKIMAEDFAQVQMLRYGQDSTTVMTAYSAVVLMKLLRGNNHLLRLVDDAANKIHSMISKAAEAYHNAALLSPASSSAEYHARFLQSLLANDVYKQQQQQQQVEQERMKRELPSLNVHHIPQNAPARSTHGYAQSQAYPQASQPVDYNSGYYVQSSVASQASAVSSGASTSSTMSSPYTPTQPAGYSQVRDGDYAMTDASVRHSSLSNLSLSGMATTYAQYQAQPTSEHDASYWRKMWCDLGIDGNVDPTSAYGVYQANGAGDSASAAASQASYGMTYRDTHVGDHGYQSHHPQPQPQHYQYPVVNAYQSAAYSSR